MNLELKTNDLEPGNIAGDTLGMIHTHYIYTQGNKEMADRRGTQLKIIHMMRQGGSKAEYHTWTFKVKQAFGLRTCSVMDPCFVNLRAGPLTYI